MRKLRALAALIPLTAVVGVTAPASAQDVTSGSFSVLSYNIAGLPFGLGDGDPEANTPVISSRLPGR